MTDPRRDLGIMLATTNTLDDLEPLEFAVAQLSSCDPLRDDAEEALQRIRRSMELIQTLLGVRVASPEGR